jgi:hypothetical protein
MTPLQVRCAEKRRRQIAFAALIASPFDCLRRLIAFTALVDVARF